MATDLPTLSQWTTSRIDDREHLCESDRSGRWLALSFIVCESNLEEPARDAVEPKWCGIVERSSSSLSGMTESSGPGTLMRLGNRGKLKPPHWVEN